MAFFADDADVFLYGTGVDEARTGPTEIRAQIARDLSQYVVATSVSLFDISGTAVGNPVNGAIVHPGQTREVAYASADAYGLHASCSFDVSTKSGVRAAFVYTSGVNGSTVVVIPAQK